MSRKYPPRTTDADPSVTEDMESLEIPPADPVETAPIATKPLETVATPIKEYLALRVFATIAGPKWDQMAGFVSHARSRKLGPLTMEDWQAEFKKFQEKPVG
jgi:hypothetical protein